MKTHLEITDMPTDNLQALGKLRTVLVGTFNKAREHKHRMKLLKEVLKFMYNQCSEYEKVAEAQEEALAKAKAEKLDNVKRTAILEEATKLELDLDERLSTEKLADELTTLKTKKEKKDTK